MKNMVKQLHKAGIEVILDVVFNHTAEYGDGGEYISFRGVDNRTYYLMNPDGTYSNLSACGNTVNCNNPIVRNFILDSLRYWVSDYHIDGFRIDEAPIFARGQDGKPMVSPPLVESLKNDPILSKAKLISEGWDPAGLSTIGKFPHGWADWNPGMRDTLKRFSKGMAGYGPELTRRIEGSPDMFAGRTPDASVNYVTSHDGFTLYDVCAYNRAHNEMNTYTSPMDTEFDNCSWNCGVEGETDDEQINTLRRRQMKNIMTILMLSRGVPMFWAGDEFANTQYGNNNAFSNDSPISWLDWGRLEKYRDVFEYTKRLIAFRKEHPVITKADFFTGYNSSGYPELSWHAERPWQLNRDEAFNAFAFMYSEPASDFGREDDCFIYCAYNAHWEWHTFELPIIPAGMSWKVVVASADESLASVGQVIGGTYDLMPRSCVVLIGCK
jgi:glycogen operon protein